MKWTAGIVFVATLGLACEDATQPEQRLPTDLVSLNIAIEVAGTDLGTLGGNESEAWAINNRGHVVGWSRTTGNEEVHAFFWDGTTMHDLGTLGGAASYATDINDQDEVVGYSFTGNGTRHAFFWAGTMHDLGTLGELDSEALSMNEAGQSTGWAGWVRGAGMAVRWNRLTAENLGTLGGDLGHGNQINELGQVAGSSRNGSGHYNAFFWDGTEMIGLPLLDGGNQSRGKAVNDAGQVAGYARDQNDNYHAVVWQDGGIIDLGIGDSRDNNNRGHVVGFLRPDPTMSMQEAFIWDGISITLLNPPGESGAALKINDVGAVAGASQDSGEPQHGFYWDGLMMYDLLPLDSRADIRDMNELGHVVGSRRAGRYNQATLWVADPLGHIERAIEVIEEWVDDGILNGGQGNALLTTLEKAGDAIADGDSNAANRLETFINKVEAFIASGKLTAEQGQPLIDVALVLIAQLGG